MRVLHLNDCSIEERRESKLKQMFKQHVGMYKDKSSKKKKLQKKKWVEKKENKSKPKQPVLTDPLSLSRITTISLPRVLARINTVNRRKAFSSKIALILGLLLLKFTTSKNTFFHKNVKGGLDPLPQNLVVAHLDLPLKR